MMTAPVFPVYSHIQSLQWQEQVEVGNVCRMNIFDWSQFHRDLYFNIHLSYTA